MDELNAPLLPIVTLIHFLTASPRAEARCAASRSHGPCIRGHSAGDSGIRRVLTLIILLIACVIPPYFELLNRGKSTRVFVRHVALRSVAGTSLVLLTECRACRAKPMGEHPVDACDPHRVGTCRYIAGL